MSHGGTFGLTSIVGTSPEANAATQQWANKRTLTVAGTITKITYYLDNPGASDQQICAAVWANSAGVPGALLAQSANVTITAGQAAGWVDFPLITPYVAVAADYWLGTMSFVITNQSRRYSLTGASGVMKYRNIGGPTNPFGSASDYTSDIALYATYT